MNRTITKAPDFNGTYPSSGELIGPAWQTAWEELDPTEWTLGDDVAAIMCENIGIKHKTAKELLRKAAYVGILATRTRVINSRRRVLYRITTRPPTGATAP